MTTEKRRNLTKYSEELKAKLKDAAPAKHKGYPESYKRYLENELRLVTATLEKDRLK